MPDNRSYGEKKSYGGTKSFGGRKSFGEMKSFGDRPSFGERKSYGDKPYGERKSYGDKPNGERKSYGDKPYGERKSYGDKPYGERKSYGDKPYGQRKSFGDKPYGERKSFGDRPGHGERRPYERKRYVPSVTNPARPPSDYAKRDSVQFRLDEESLDQLQTLADAAGMPTGALVKTWVLERLSGQPASTPTPPAEVQSVQVVNETETSAFEDRLTSLEARVAELETR